MEIYLGKGFTGLPSSIYYTDEWKNKYGEKIPGLIQRYENGDQYFTPTNKAHLQIEEL